MAHRVIYLNAFGRWTTKIVPNLEMAQEFAKSLPNQNGIIIQDVMMPVPEHTRFQKRKNTMLKNGLIKTVKCKCGLRNRLTSDALCRVCSGATSVPSANW